MDEGAQFCNTCGAKSVPDAWKCGMCETLNTGDTCIICGASKDDAVKPEPVKKEIKKEEKTVSPVPAKKKKKGKGFLVVLAIAAALIAGWFVGASLGIFPGIDININL